MGSAKELLIHREEYHKLVIDILIHLGELKECDCGCYYVLNDFYEEKELYAIVTNEFQKTEKNIDYHLLHETIKTIITESGIETTCPHCGNKLR